MMSIGGSSSHESRRHFSGKGLKSKIGHKKRMKNLKNKYLRDDLADGARGEMIQL